MATWVTVTGRYVRSGTPEDEAPIPARGSVVFTLSSPLIDPAGDTIFDTKPVKARLDETGAFAVDLLANDDGTLQPTGTSYKVEENIRGAALRTWTLQVPTTAAATGLDLADASPAVPGPEVFSYASQAALLSALAEVDALREELTADTSLVSRVDAIEDALPVTQAALEDEAELRQAADTALDGRLDTIEPVVAGHIVQIGDLQDADTALTGRVTILESSAGSDLGPRVEAVEADVAALETADAGLDARIDTVEATLPTKASTASLTSEQNARIAGDNALDGRLDTVEATLPNKADLVAGLIPTSQIPSLALTAAIPVANQAAMLALTSTQVQPGDLAVRADGAGTFVLVGTPPSVLANWRRLDAPTDAVTSVNGQVGTVNLSAANVGAPTAAALSAETTARISGDDALDARLDTIEGQNLNSRVTTAESDIDALQAGQTDVVNTQLPNKADKNQIKGRVFTGTGAPGTVSGSQNTDWYLDKTARLLYGPLLDGDWGTPVPLDEVTQAELDALATTVAGKASAAALDAEVQARLDADAGLDARLDTLEAAGPGAVALDDLTDVDLVGAIDGNVLKRVAGVWVPATDEAGAGTVTGIIHSGTGTPPAGVGLTGDYYHSTDLERLYGPKGSDTVWGTAATPVFRAASESTTADSPNVIPLPTGTQVGDLLILSAKSFLGTLALTSSGWTERFNNATQNSRVAVWTKTATQADLDAGSVTLTGNDDYLRGLLAAYRQTDGVLEVLTGIQNGGNGTVNSHANASGDTTLQVVSILNTGTPQYMSGYDVRADSTSAEGGMGAMSLSDRAVGAGAATTTFDTGGNYAFWVSVLLDPALVVNYVDLSDHPVTQAELDAAVAALDTRVDALEGGGGGGVYQGVYGGILREDEFADLAIPADYILTGGAARTPAVVSGLTIPGTTTTTAMYGPKTSLGTAYQELQVTVPAGGATLSFLEMSESEASYDIFSFRIDGVEQFAVSGIRTWTSRSYELAEGTHTLQWRYFTDGSGSTGIDGYRITDVTLTVPQAFAAGDFVRDEDGALWQAKVDDPVGAPIEGANWTQVLPAPQVTQAELDALDARVDTLEAAPAAEVTQAELDAVEATVLGRLWSGAGAPGTVRPAVELVQTSDTNVFATAPATGSVIVVALGAGDEAAATISGLGGTWAQLAEEQDNPANNYAAAKLWWCKDPDGVGTTITVGGMGGAPAVAMYELAKVDKTLTPAAAAVSSDGVNNTGTQTGPTLTPSEVGDFLISALYNNGGTYSSTTYLDQAWTAGPTSPVCHHQVATNTSAQRVTRNLSPGYRYAAVGAVFRGDPNADQGWADGDYYLDKTNRNIYGPLTGGAWGTPVPLDEVTQAELDALDARVDALEAATDLAGPTIVTFTMTGAVTTHVGAERLYNDSGRTLTIQRVRASLKTAGATDTIVDVNKDGTTLFTTQGERPTLGNGVVTDAEVPDVTTWEDGSYLTVDVDTAGTGAETLTVQVTAT